MTGKNVAQVGHEGRRRKGSKVQLRYEFLQKVEISSTAINPINKVL